jgi:membrane fusion protein, multidrug efflux system
MALEVQGRDREEASLPEQSAPDFSHGVVGNGQASADAEKGTIRARAGAADERSPCLRRDAELSPEREAPHLARDREDGDEPRNGLLRRHPLAFLLGLLLLILVAAAGYLYWDYAKRFESTDDAFIAARQFAIAPKVSGYLTAVPVTDNQHVAAGAVITRIDERDFRVALEQAQAQVASAEAGIQNIDAQIKVQRAQIASNQAQVDQAQAALVFARQQAARFQDLAEKGAGTVMNAQQFTSQLHQQEAALQSAKANLTLSQRQIESLKAQRENAVASLAQAKAQRDQAELNLSYTTVTADQPGRVVQLSAAVGQFAQAGTNLTMFVPDEIWVAANFKETQLDAMRPGQPVKLTIDAYPERSIRGHVASVQPGSGTAFSLLPAENATGNFVKIVQRVPVKIIMDNPPSDVALGPGMSVVPTVQVSSAPSLLAQLRALL